MKYPLNCLFKTLQVTNCSVHVYMYKVMFHNIHCICTLDYWMQIQCMIWYHMVIDINLFHFVLILLFQWWTMIQSLGINLNLCFLKTTESHLLKRVSFPCNTCTHSQQCNKTLNSGKEKSNIKIVFVTKEVILTVHSSS